MGEQVSWVLELNVKPGQLESFRSLMNEMVEATKGETGTEMYEWFVSEDGTKIHIYERYADSDATLTHLNNFGQHFAKRFMSMVEPTRFVVYGAPNEQAKSALDGLRATYYDPFGGFAR
jgi:quinol monooxygenase YgiN